VTASMKPHRQLLPATVQWARRWSRKLPSGCWYLMQPCP